MASRSPITCSSDAFATISRDAASTCPCSLRRRPAARTAPARSRSSRSSRSAGATSLMYSCTPQTSLTRRARPGSCRRSRASRGTPASRRPGVWHLDFAGDQAVGRRGDRLRGDRQHGERRSPRRARSRRTCGGRRLRSPVEACVTCGFDGFVHVALLRSGVEIRGRPARRRACNGRAPAPRARGTACSCPGSRSAGARRRQCATGSKMHRSAAAPVRDRAGRHAEDARGRARDARERVGETARLPRCAHLSVSGSSSSSPVAPGSASPKGTCFASSSTGAWSEHTTSIVPSARPARSAARSRVPRSGGIEPRLGVEPADVDVATGAGGATATSHVTASPRASPRAPSRRLPPSTAGSTWTRTPVSRTSARIVASAIVSAHAGTAGEAEPRRDLAVVRDAAAREVARPAAAARRDGRTSPRTASRAQQHRVSASGMSRLRERDAARLRRARPSR